MLLADSCGTCWSRKRPRIEDSYYCYRGAFSWNSVNSSGEVEGFDVDVGKALCERAEISCRFVAQAWDGIIPGLTVGKYDAVMAGMSITEKERKS